MSAIDDEEEVEAPQTLRRRKGMSRSDQEAHERYVYNCDTAIRDRYQKSGLSRSYWGIDRDEDLEGCRRKVRERWGKVKLNDPDPDPYISSVAIAAILAGHQEEYTDQYTLTREDLGFDQIYLLKPFLAAGHINWSELRKRVKMGYLDPYFVPPLSIDSQGMNIHSIEESAIRELLTRARLPFTQYHHHALWCETGSGDDQGSNNLAWKEYLEGWKLIDEIAESKRRGKLMIGHIEGIPKHLTGDQWNMLERIGIEDIFVLMEPRALVETMYPINKNGESVLCSTVRDDLIRFYERVMPKMEKFINLLYELSERVERSDAAQKDFLHARLRRRIDHHDKYAMIGKVGPSDRKHQGFIYVGPDGSHTILDETSTPPLVQPPLVPPPLVPPPLVPPPLVPPPLVPPPLECRPEVLKPLVYATTVMFRTIAINIAISCVMGVLWLLCKEKWHDWEAVEIVFLPFMIAIMIALVYRLSRSLMHCGERRDWLPTWVSDKNRAIPKKHRTELHGALTSTAIGFASMLDISSMSIALLEGKWVIGWHPTIQALSLIIPSLGMIFFGGAAWIISSCDR